MKVLAGFFLTWLSNLSKSRLNSELVSSLLFQNGAVLDVDGNVVLSFDLAVVHLAN